MGAEYLKTIKKWKITYFSYRYAFGLDCDKKYIEVTHDILEEKFEGEVFYDLMQVDVNKWNTEKMKGFFDIVVMNPPFGTKEEGIDYLFLRKAFEICKGTVYSFHKSSSIEVR